MESFARCGGLERGLMVVRTSGFCGCGAGGLRRAGVLAGRQCIMTHTGVKPHQCNQCGYSSTTLENRLIFARLK